ncbi:MAG: hypothetical protein M1434_11270 [Chloroflexi bacterium]|nr:hypothetical protein [Chloroflexota bacterium]MCL5275304.1 hypothetical protein [Chloroflexota bacterium]
MPSDEEKLACKPVPLTSTGFNVSAQLPHGLQVAHIKAAMEDFLDFIGFINQQLSTKSIMRIESMLMPANFSSIVGEFMSSTLPKYCASIVKNRYHNGHPDLIPIGVFPDDAAQHASDGIEIKASRYNRGWQGHNPENTWLMVFVFDSNRPSDITPKSFQFKMVVGAQLTKSDWIYSGRSATSRRTITASVTDTGYQKMMTNWIYKA